MSDLKLAIAPEPRVQTLKHKCVDGAHTRLIAKSVSGRLQFVCDGCKAYYYWDAEFLLMLVQILKLGGEYTFTFE